jgi:hypothetical protein
MLVGTQLKGRYEKHIGQNTFKQMGASFLTRCWGKMINSSVVHSEILFWLKWWFWTGRTWTKLRFFLKQSVEQKHAYVTPQELNYSFLWQKYRSLVPLQAVGYHYMDTYCHLRLYGYTSYCTTEAQTFAAARGYRISFSNWYTVH